MTVSSEEACGLGTRPYLPVSCEPRDGGARPLGGSTEASRSSPHQGGGSTQLFSLLWCALCGLPGSLWDLAFVAHSGNSNDNIHSLGVLPLLPCFYTSIPIFPGRLSKNRKSNSHSNLSSTPYVWRDSS